MMDTQVANTLLGQAICAEHAWDFAAQFPNQYLLQETPEHPAPAGWLQDTYDRWSLWRAPELPLRKILDVNGFQVGLLWGHAITPTGKIDDAAVSLPFAVSETAFFDGLDAWVVDLRGRYAFIATKETNAYFYTDPGGDVGAMFDPQSRRIGSSLPVVLSRKVNLHITARNEDALKTGGALFRFQGSVDAGVQRLNPNFKLDLHTYEPKRFWPVEVGDIVTTDAEIALLRDQIIERLTHNIVAFVGYQSTAIPISGGYDSRILLLLAKKANCKIGCVFTHRTNWISGYDSLMAHELCEQLELPHTFLDAKTLVASPYWRKAARQEQKAAWLRSGFSWPVPRAATVLAPLLVPNNKLVLRGNIMEMLGGRFHQIQNHKEPEQVFNLVYGRQPETSHESEYWLREYDNWQSNLPSLQGKNGQDLCFLENLYPSAMAVALQSMPFGCYLNPFSDRRLIGWTMQVPSSERRGGAFYRQILTGSHATIPVPRNPKRVARGDKDGATLDAFLTERGASSAQIDLDARKRLQARLPDIKPAK